MGLRRRTDGANPVTQAREAYLRGDAVLALQLSVSHPDDPPTLSESLNAVCAEGWDLVDGSVVAPEANGMARITVAGEVTGSRTLLLGYYLFRRRA